MFSRIRKAMSSEKGFTLVELLVVIGIIGILAMMLLPQFRGMRDRARIASCMSNLKNIGTTLEAFYADREQYPLPGQWATLIGASGGLETIHQCPQDKTDYIYLPAIELNAASTLTASDVFDYTIAADNTTVTQGTSLVGTAATDTTTTRVDAYVVLCPFHDGSGATAPEETQLLVTQNGVTRKP